MNFPDQLNHLEATVRGAKAMPMSTSCLVNRAEVLEMVEGLRGALPADLDHASTVLSERDAILAAGREQAARLVEAARGERERLIDQNSVLVAARERAASVIADARGESIRLLADADGYVDRKLSDFETLLGQLGSQVNNGRLRLTTRRGADLAHFEESGQGPKRGAAKGAVHSDHTSGTGSLARPAESGAPFDPAVVERQGPTAVEASPGAR